MSDKRFEADIDHLLLVWDTEKNKRLEIEDIVGVLNEQQAEIDELKKNFDDLVQWASEIAKRNVVLGEENASLKQRIRDIKYNNCD